MEEILAVDAYSTEEAVVAIEQNQLSRSKGGVEVIVDRHCMKSEAAAFASSSFDLCNLPALPQCVQARSDLVERLKNHFFPPDAANNLEPIPAKTIVGLVGTGKSTLAALYAHAQLSSACYDFVRWMSMDSEASMRSSWLLFARDLGICTDKLTNAEVVSRVLGLVKEQRWLLVFDNVTSVETSTASIQVGGGLGLRHHVLITSRNENSTYWQETFTELKVDPALLSVGAFEVDESVALVRAVLAAEAEQEHGHGQERRPREVFCEMDSRLLHLTMGGLPLALSLALGYTGTHDHGHSHDGDQDSTDDPAVAHQKGVMDVSEFVSLFNWHGLTPLSSPSSAEGKAALTVGSLWKLTVEGGVSVESLRLMTLVSLLHPDHLCPHLLARLAGEDAEAAMAASLKPLLRSSLISFDVEQEVFRVHRSVQAAVYSAQLGTDSSDTGTGTGTDAPLCIDSIAKWVEPAVAAVLGLFPDEDESACMSGADDLQHLLNECLHAEVLLDFVKKQSAAAESSSNSSTLGALRPLEYRLSMKLGWVMQLRQLPSEALVLFERGLELSRLSHPGAHSDTAAALCSLGGAHSVMGAHSAAVSALEESLCMRTHIFGPTHLCVAEVLNLLGEVSLAQRRHDDAGRLFEEAQRAMGGQSHPFAAVVFSNVGLMLSEQKDLSGAAAAHRSAMQIRISVLGSEHPSVASSLVLLGAICRQLGQYAEAKDQFVEALRIRRLVYGENHHSVAPVLIGLGSLQFCALGLSAAALQSYEAALVVCRRAHGADQPEVAEVLHLIGTVYRQKGAFERAVESFEEALSIWVRAYGRDSPKVADVLTSIGFVHSQQGNWGLAVERLEEALRVRQLVHGPDSLLVVDDLLNLGGIYHKHEAFVPALQQYQEALRIRKLAFGSAHADVATTLVLLAAVLVAAGSFAEAVERQEEALAIREKLSGSDHPAVAMAVDSIAAVLLKQGRVGAAMSRYEEGVEIRKRFYPPNMPQVSSAVERLAGAYKVQGLYKEAIEKFEEALKMRRLAHGANHPEVATVLCSIGGIQIKLGRPELAHKPLEEALRILKLIHGADHVKVGDVLVSLGRVQHSLDAFDPALERYEESLRIRRKAFGRDHVAVAEVLTCMAATLQSQGALAPALTHLEEALGVQRRLHGPDHPLASEVLILIRQVYSAQFTDYLHTRRRETKSPVGKFSGTKKQAAADFLLDFVESGAFTGIAVEAARAVRALPEYGRFKETLSEGRIGGLFHRLFGAD